MAPVPLFPLVEEPGTWDELTLAAATVFLEAEGEPDAGKLGVAWVIRHRADTVGSVHQAILGADGLAYADGRPYEAFSCWNDDYRTRASARLASVVPETSWTSWRAAAGALWRLAPDPTKGANFYLNVPLTRAIRGGTLPAWAEEKLANQTPVVIGNHHFLV